MRVVETLAPAALPASFAPLGLKYLEEHELRKLAGRGVDMKKLSGCMVQCHRADFIEWFDVEEGRAWDQETDVTAPQPGSLRALLILSPGNLKIG